MPENEETKTEEEVPLEEISYQEFMVGLDTIERHWYETANKALEKVNSINMMRMYIERNRNYGLIVRFYRAENGSLSYYSDMKDRIGFVKE